MQLLFSFLFMIPFCWSEYRVFQFKIRNLATESERTVESTLDPWQYSTYHPLKRDEKLEWVDHWMCWRRQDPFTPLCKRPGSELEPKSDSAEENAKPQET